MAKRAETTGRTKEEIWGATLKRARGKVSRANYETYFETMFLVSLDGEVATIGFPSWLHPEMPLRFGKFLKGELRAVLHRPINVTMVTMKATEEDEEES